MISLIEQSLNSIELIMMMIIIIMIIIIEWKFGCNGNLILIWYRRGYRALTRRSRASIRPIRNALYRRRITTAVSCRISAPNWRADATDSPPSSCTGPRTSSSAAPAKIKPDTSSSKWLFNQIQFQSNSISIH